MSIEDGGPAFPRSETGDAEVGQIDEGAPGMSLRDWFAGMALQGLLAAQIHGFTDRPVNGPFVDMASELADAMIERKRQDEEE